MTFIVSLLCGWFALESDSAFLAEFFSKHDRAESGFISVNVSKFLYLSKAAGFLSDSLIIMEVAAY